MTNSSSTVLGANLTQEATVDIAKAAFTYGFPLVIMDLTKEQSTNCEQPSAQGAPINQFSNKEGFPTPSDTGVVRPNCDTYYSIAFIDLGRGPQVMTIPATGDQYYMMPLLDGFTNVIDGSPGSRTGDTAGGNYLLVTKNSHIPSNVDTSQFTIITSQTDLIWALGRFQVDDTSTDDDSVNGAGYVTSLQNNLKITPLSKWGSNYQPPNGLINPNVDTTDPNDIVAGMDITAFFERLNALLKTNPPTSDDDPAMELFAQIGVGPYKTTPFQDMDFDADTLSTMENIPNEMVTAYTNAGNSSSEGTTWNVNLDPEMGNYGTDYKKRAIIACIGLGANRIEDAVYYNTSQDAEGVQLSCANGQKYTFTLDPLPPVDGFWSLTMYDESGNLVANAIDRYVLGHSANFPLEPTNPEGGPKEIYIQHQSIPSESSKYNNWLPAPKGPFTLLLRAYDPTGGDTGPIISGDWNPPGVIKVRE